MYFLFSKGIFFVFNTVVWLYNAAKRMTQKAIRACFHRGTVYSINWIVEPIHRSRDCQAFALPIRERWSVLERLRVDCLMGEDHHTDKTINKHLGINRCAFVTFVWVLDTVSWNRSKTCVKEIEKWHCHFTNGHGIYGQLHHDFRENNILIVQLTIQEL